MRLGSLISGLIGNSIRRYIKNRGTGTEQRHSAVLETSSVNPDIAGPESTMEGGEMYSHDW